MDAKLAAAAAAAYRFHVVKRDREPNDRLCVTETYLVIMTVACCAQYKLKLN